MIEIPLNASPEQEFSITVDKTTYNLRVILNSRTSTWTIDVSTSSGPLLYGVSLLGGVDIFKQYNIPINNAYVVNLDKPNLDPGKELGIVSKLFILTEEEIQNA